MKNAIEPYNKHEDEFILRKSVELPPKFRESFIFLVRCICKGVGFMGLSVISTLSFCIAFSQFLDLHVVTSIFYYAVCILGCFGSTYCLQGLQDDIENHIEERESKFSIQGSRTSDNKPLLRGR